MTDHALSALRTITSGSARVRANSGRLATVGRSPRGDHLGVGTIRRVSTSGRAKKRTFCSSRTSLSITWSYRAESRAQYLGEPRRRDSPAPNARPLTAHQSDNRKVFVCFNWMEISHEDFDDFCACCRRPACRNGQYPTTAIALSRNGGHADDARTPQLREYRQTPVRGY
jgi:hypothetical protein